MVSQYDIYVKDALLMVFHLPFSNLQSDHYSLSHFEKRPIFVVISQPLNE